MNIKMIFLLVGVISLVPRALSQQITLVGSATCSAGGKATSGALNLTSTVGQPSPLAVTPATGGGLTLLSGFISLLNADLIAPTITHSVPGVHPVGTQLPITATIIDNIVVASESLYYRRSGDPSWVGAPMTQQGGNYSATIPAGSVTDRGVEYIIVARDPSNNRGRSPSTGYHAVRVRVEGEGVLSGAPQPGGSAQNAYRILSLPMDITTRTVQAILVDDLGPFDNREWRIFDLANGQPVELNASSTLAPGKGYWLIVRQGGRVIDTGPANSYATASAYSPISLTSGWNFIGNPFNFSIPVSKVSLSNSQSVVLRSYQGAWNDPTSAPVASIEPFSGYAVNLNGAATLSIDPDLSAGPLPKTGVGGLDNLAWRIKIHAHCDGASDVDNIAAVSGEASEDRDDLDMIEPPIIGEYVSVSFPQKRVMEKYCVDVRPLPQEGVVWDFEVRSNINKEMNLNFLDVEGVPQHFDIVMVDEMLKTTCNLRRADSYSYPNAAHTRRFSLVVGTSTFVSANLVSRGTLPTAFELLQNFPNPFNPSTTIRYGLPVDATVTLKVYNVLGQEVATLINNELQEKGYKAVTFDAAKVSSGIYFYRMEAGNFVVTRKMQVLK